MIKGLTATQPGPSRIRVVYVDHVARLSGAEIALLRLLPELQHVCDVHVILGEDGPLVERLREQGVPVEVLAMPERLRDVARAATSLLRLDVRALAAMPAYVLRLSRRLRALEPDVVETNTLKAALYGGVAGRLARVPVVWHVRDRIANDSSLPGATVRIIRIAGRLLPRAVVATSSSTAATLSQPGVTVVPDTVEPPCALPPRTTRMFTVGVLGRLSPVKGQDVFLRAFGEAFAGLPARARLVGSAMFGEDAYAEELRHLAVELGIAEQVEFRGFREDIWDELAQLDILVHCSTVAEAFGQVVLEGMAAGLPVIAARAGGPCELIDDEADGLLTNPADSRELAHALRRLHDDPALRERLGRAAREKSRAFTAQRAASALVAVYEATMRR